jgi:hypothetical protein
VGTAGNVKASELVRATEKAVGRGENYETYGTDERRVRRTLTKQ